MASTGDIISAIIVGSIFLGIIFAFVRSQQALKDSVAQRTTNLQQKGFHIDSTGVKIKTNTPAMSQDEYVQTTAHSLQTTGKRLVDGAKKGAIKIGQKAEYKQESNNGGTPDWAK